MTRRLLYVTICTLLLSVFAHAQSNVQSLHPGETSGTANGSVMLVGDYASIGVTISGTFSGGTVPFELSNDNFATVSGITLVQGTNPADGTASSAPSATGAWNIPCAGFVYFRARFSSVTGNIKVLAKPSTYILGKRGGGGSGTVTSASVASANGFAGSVATATTTPAITVSTTITGLLKGNGTAISAAVANADYAPAASPTITGTATLARTINTPVALTDAATIAVDASLGNNFRVTLTDNRTLGNPTNAVNGQTLTFEIIQDGTGSHTLAYDTKFAFGTDITGCTLTTTASKRDFITVYYNSTSDKFYVRGCVKGY